MSSSVSDGERRFVVDCVRLGVRVDGRSRHDLRPIVLEVGTLPQMSGSAQVKKPNGHVMVGVRGELCAPDENTPDEGFLYCTVTCGANVMVPRLYGTREAWSTYLADALRTSWLAHDTVDLKKLCLAPGKLCWTLCVDVYVAQSECGDVLDIASLACQQALSNTLLPKVDPENVNASEIAVAAHVEFAGALPMRSAAPLCVTFAIIDAHLVADPDDLEERCAGALLHVFVDVEHGTVLSASTHGNCLGGGASDATHGHAIAAAPRIAAKVSEQAARAAAAQAAVRGAPLSFK